MLHLGVIVPRIAIRAPETIKVRDALHANFSKSSIPTSPSNATCVFFIVIRMARRAELRYVLYFPNFARPLFQR